MAMFFNAQWIGKSPQLYQDFSGQGKRTLLGADGLLKKNFKKPDVI
ncbi:MAG: hypothetical protein R3F19_23230 [Verrucomicrobiales bacterium]